MGLAGQKRSVLTICRKNAVWTKIRKKVRLGSGRVTQIYRQKGQNRTCSNPPTCRMVAPQRARGIDFRGWNHHHQNIENSGNFGDCMKRRIPFMTAITPADVRTQVNLLDKTDSTVPCQNWLPRTDFCISSMFAPQHAKGHRDGSGCCRISQWQNRCHVLSSHHDRGGELGHDWSVIFSRSTWSSGSMNSRAFIIITQVFAWAGSRARMYSCCVGVTECADCRWVLSA